MRYFVLKEWCNIQTETEVPFNTCVIGRATNSDDLYDGYNCESATGGYTFDIYNSIKEAILNAKYDLKAIRFDDFTKEELAEANKVIEGALQKELKVNRKVIKE